MTVLKFLVNCTFYDIAAQQGCITTALYITVSFEDAEQGRLHR